MFYQIFASEGRKTVLNALELPGDEPLSRGWSSTRLLIFCFAMNKLSSVGSGGSSSSWNDQLILIFEPGLKGVRDIRCIHVPTLCHRRVQNWTISTTVYRERNSRPRMFVFRTWSFLPCAMIVSMMVSHRMLITTNIIRPVLRSSTNLSFSSSLWLNAACSGKRQTVRSFSQNFTSCGHCGITGALSSSIRAFRISLWTEIQIRALC